MTYNAEQITFMLAEAIDQDREYKSWHVSTKHLMALVERVVAEEREACAKIAEEESTRGLPEEEPKGKHLKTAIVQIVCGTVIAEAIRNRGQV
jgi:hypothetical protein